MGVKMNKKIFTLLFFMFVLISVSAVSAVDLDDNNGTVASSNDADSLAIANDVNAIDDLNENDSDGDINSVAAGKDNENNLLSVNNDENENILKGDEADFEELEKEITRIDPRGVVLKHKNYKIDEGETILLRQYSHVINGNGATIDMNGNDFALLSASTSPLIVIGNLTIKNMDSEHDRGVVLIIDSRAAVKNCTFVNNRASLGGGAIMVSRSERFEITGCTFVNNIGNESGAIYFKDYFKNCKIENCAFVNNSASGGKSAIGGNIGSTSLNDNWWGSNNPNWQDLINAHAPTGYAVLICSIDTPSIAIGSKAKLTYAFYRNGTADMLPIPARPIKLSATGGKLDDDSGNLVNGEFTTEFSADKIGNYEITAKVDNQEIKINIAVGSPTEINITNETIDLKAGEVVATGAALDPSGAGNLTYTSSNSSVAVVENGMIKGLRQGVANITVSFAGNENYAAAENKTIAVTVHLNDACVEAKDMELNAGENATVEYKTTPEGLKTTFLSDESGVYSVDENGVVNALKGGNATIVVKVGGDGVYAENSTTVTVTVNKVPTEINITNETVNLKANSEVPTGATLTPADAGNLTYSSSNSSVAVVENGKIKGIKQGEANITVSFAGNDKYIAAENKTIAVSVGLADACVTVNNDTLNLKIDDTFVINATTAPEGLNVTYVSDDSGVYSVDENGVVTALRNGTGFIIVSVGDDEVYAKNTTVVTVSVSLKDASVTVNNDTLNLKIDDTFVINATTAPEGLNVTYVSDDSGVYSVDENGVVTALRNGTGFIIVSVGDDEVYAKNTTVVTVSVSLNDACVSGEDMALNVGEIGAIKYSTDPEGLKVSFVEDDSGVVSVDEHGIVTALKQGKANITITVGDNRRYALNSTVVTVSVSLNDACVSGEDMALNVGETGAIKYSAVPKGLDVSFVEDGSGVVSVDEHGIVTALKQGSANVTITVGDNKKYALNSTTVAVSVSLNDASVSGEDMALNVGETGAIKYSAVPKGLDVSFVEDGSGVVSVDEHGIVTALKQGSANITITVGDNKKYALNSTIICVNVHGLPSKIIIENDTLDMIIGDVVDPGVTLMPSDAGNLSFTVSDENIVLVNGYGVVTAVGVGNATIFVRFDGNDKYLPSNATITVSVKNALIIKAPDVVKYYGGPERFVVNVTDSKGTPLSNKSVTIVINKVTYNRTTDENGIASMAIVLPSGTFNATVTVDNNTVNSVVNVLTTVNGTDVVKVFRNATQYYTTFRDSEGNYLKEGTLVTFNINGVFYDRKVSTNGLAKLNINLEPGKYIITAMNNVTGEQSSNIITVLSRITENNDITKYYRNATQYTAKIIGDDGKAVGAGESVTFNINGVFYTRQTDANGIVKLNINLQPGDYILTAEYKGCMVSNKIKVLPVLTAKDITKKYGSPDQFVASLVDGQGKAFANQKIEFNINGVFYYRTTDSTGAAKLNINLMPGEYIITSSYNGSSIANKITVKS